MLRALDSWIRTTFDYNPSFPLSALALLVGLALVGADSGDGLAGTGGSVGAGATAAGVGVLQTYGLCLLGTVLLVLWPRRIAYETTAILILLAVVRFAAPFLVIGLAADGHLGWALALGAALWSVNTLEGEAIQRRVGLDLRRWERAYDYGLFALVTLGLPLLANRLPHWTGDALSHAGARTVQLSAWWALVALLLPLSLGLGEFRRAAPLRSRRPAAVWRGLTVAGVTTLLYAALWLAGGAPFLLALLPLGLVAAALWGSVVRARGGATPAWAPQLPAALLALALLLPLSRLCGPVPFVSHPAAVLALLLLGAASLPFVAPGALRRGLLTLGAVAGLAPLRFLDGWLIAELYLGCVAALVLAAAAWGRVDRPFAVAAVALALLGAHLAPSLGIAPPLLTLALLGATLALLVAWRLPADADEEAARVALTLCVGAPLAGIVLHPPDLAHLVPLLAAPGALALLGWSRARPAWVRLAGLVGAAVLARRAATAAEPGVVLILLAFAAIPAGTWIALRRERIAAGARAAVAAGLQGTNERPDDAAFAGAPAVAGVGFEIAAGARASRSRPPRPTPEARGVPGGHEARCAPGGHEALAGEGRHGLLDQTGAAWRSRGDPRLEPDPASASAGGSDPDPAAADEPVACAPSDVTGRGERA